MNKVMQFLQKLLSGTALRDVSDVLDEIITNKEERQQLINELKKEEFRHLEQLEAIKARVYEKELEHLQTELNTEVQLRQEAVKLATNKNNSFLQKNIAPFLAIIATAQAVIIYILVLIHRIKATEPTVLLVVSNVTNLVLVVFGFYFGSSVGSKLKDKNNI